MQFDHLKRRDFIALLGGAAAWPLAAGAQQPDRIRRIGVLAALPEDDPEMTARLAGAHGHCFRSSHGIVDHRTVEILPGSHGEPNY